MRRWPFVALFLGLALQVAAWILVIPPYSTYDEFDHVYRASSVWHGQITAIHNPPSGYPGAVIADADLVADGVTECMRLPYTGLGRCLPGPSRPEGTVLVSSGAALYNPLYYVLVSPATALGHGASTVMWMRVWSALLTFALLAWALNLLSCYRLGRRAVLGVALAAPPMLAISMAVVAPNGLEMAAGLLWWISLVTLTGPLPPRTRSWAALCLAGCLLAALRSLGPLFLIVAFLVILIWRPSALRRLWRTDRRAALASTIPIAASLGLSALWILTQHIQAIETPTVIPDLGIPEGIAKAVGYAPVMVTLFVGAIPARNLAPPGIAVAAWLIPFTLVLANVRWRRSRATWGLLTLIVVVLAFPVIFQGVLFGRLGFFWQSRYILPLAIGIPLLAALRGRSDPSRDRTNDIVTVVGLLIAHTTLIRFGLAWYDTHSPLVSANRFPLVAEPVPLMLSVLGVLATGASLWLAQSRTLSSGEVGTDGPDSIAAPASASLPSLVSSSRAQEGPSG